MKPNWNFAVSLATMRSVPSARPKPAPTAWPRTAAIVGTLLTGWWWIAACGLLPLALIAQSLLLTPRRVRAIGYLDGEEDLTIASGIMFRSVHSIPYGRVQSVKIGEGPIERRYGLATLTITTAAGGGTETLPGLPKAEAERLRSLLTDRGIELMAAL